MRILTRFVSLILLLLGAATAQSAAAPSANVGANGAARQPADREVVRAQLAAYFKGIEKNSPTVLGGLAKSPEAMKAVQERIATMDDAELSRMQRLMASTPDWKAAPEAFATAFPPAVLDQARRVGADYASQVPKGEIMRDDVRTLVSVLKLLPDTKLKELGVDRKMVTSLDETFAGMTPLQTAMLQRRAIESGGFGETTASALHAIPPAMQRGAGALAEHGPLSEKDVEDLNKFRIELEGLLGRINALPADAKKKLQSFDSAALNGQLTQLRAATPQALFMMRYNMSQEMLQNLRQNVAFLERISNISKEETAALEKFRGELTHAFKQVRVEGQPEWEGATAMMAGLGTEHLLVLQQRMNSYGSWQSALPAVYQTLSASETRSRLQAVSGPEPDPDAVRTNDAFRRQALAYIDSLKADKDLDASFIAKARATIVNASAERLELIRMAIERLPASASASERLAIVAMHNIDFGCSLTFTAIPRLCTPGGCLFGVCIPEICTPAVTVTADFSSVCNPIEDAMEAVEHSIVNTANAAVETMRSGIQASITGVQSAVNTSIASVNTVISTSVNAITSTVNEIAAFAQKIPDLAWKAIKAALNLLLDINIKNGVTLRDLIASGPQTALTSMTSLVGLSGSWWTAISSFTLPLIPCPPTGFNTPFGVVGDGAASANYGRYRLMIDGILGLIPDTETSLVVKIPAQVTFMMFDFLGLCLEQAASDADAAEGTARHNLIIANFGTMQTFVGSQIAGLTATSGNQSASLLTLLSTQGASTQATLLGSSQATQSLINSQTASLQNLLTTDSNSIQSLLRIENDATQVDVKSFRDLDLRLTIERVLQAGTGDEVASFQLLEPWGNLRLVAGIVDETIRSMVIAQEGIGMAQKYYDAASVLINDAKYKLAYRELSKAYREATK